MPILRGLGNPAELRFGDLRFDGAMDDVREGASVGDDVLDARLVAFSNEVIQKCACVEFGQEVGVVLGKITVGENEIDVAFEGGQIQCVKIVRRAFGLVSSNACV